MKIFKICFILIFLFFISFSHSYAIDMYLTGNNTLETNSVETNNIDNVDNTTLNSVSSNPSVVISSREDSTSNELTTSDIINIILIAVGVVIILLAVAILIRCR